jgi:hypothetical protein
MLISLLFIPKKAIWLLLSYEDPGRPGHSLSCQQKDDITRNRSQEPAAPSAIHGAVFLSSHTPLLLMTEMGSNCKAPGASMAFQDLH